MLKQELETRLKDVEQNIDAIKNDITIKLDQLNSIAQDIKVSALSVNEKIKRQEQFLEEIRIGADFRKRESENSVRELKTQMNSMEIHSESMSKDVIQKILDAIKTSETIQTQQIIKMDEKFNKKLNSFEHKLKFYSGISITSITLSLITIILIFLL